MDVVETVRESYLARWGKPSREAWFQTDVDQIEVYKWDASANGEGVDMYATLGASAEDMPGTEPGHRVEYFVGLQPGKDEIASPLAALGLYAHRENVTIDHGHTVPSDDPLWPGTEMNIFLVLRQLGEILPALKQPNGAHVEFLQTIPIYQSERRFKAAHGAEALLQRWEAIGVPFWDPDRTAEPAT